MKREPHPLRRLGRYLFAAAFAVSCLATVQACSQGDPFGEAEQATLAADEATAELSDETAEFGSLEQAAVACSSVAQCVPGPVCTATTCQLGQCLLRPSPVGTVCGINRVCNGTGSCVNTQPTCSSSAQCAPGPVCTTSFCQGGQCLLRQSPAGTVCGSNRVCNGSGSCVSAPPACTSNAQCPASGQACVTNTCQAGQCVLRPSPAGTACGFGGSCSSSGTCIIIR